MLLKPCSRLKIAQLSQILRIRALKAVQYVDETNELFARKTGYLVDARAQFVDLFKLHSRVGA
jgi:hypothetical protein